MYKINIKSFLMTLIFSINILQTLQTPLVHNYTASLLRHAKSAEIQAFTNSEFNSCEDFYQYSCGNWQRSHPAMSNLTKTSYLGQIQELYKRKSIEMLKTERQSDRSYQQKLKQFFESCSNEVALARSGLEPILKVVDFKGGWPRIVVPSWYEYEYDWLKTIAELRSKLGVDIFVGLEVIPDFSEKDFNRIKIGAPKLHLGSRGVYLNSSYANKREEYMEEITHKLRKYFSYMPAKWASEVAQQILDIERKLAQGLPKDEESTVQQTSRRRFVSELKDAYGNYVDLSRYITWIFNQTIQTHVYETPEDYLSNLVNIIKETPKLTLANYTMWRVLETFDFSGAINDEHNDDWCIERIMEYFPNQLENMFYSHFNSIPLRNELWSVWKDIKQTFQEELKKSGNLNWLTQATRQHAIGKLDAMTLNIEEHNSDHIEYEMLNFKFDKYKYYENLLQILQWDTKRKLAELNKTPQNEQIHEYELPTYELSKNRIQIPIVFLQSRFLWDPALPHALKYGTLGFLLAQEMLHGFDGEGRKYDKHGNQHSEWDNASEVAYEKRAECLINQYEHKEFYQNHVFEQDMISKIITFNGALGIAFRAYKQWMENTPENILRPHEILPKLQHEPKQLFFLGFSQMWCAAYDEKFKQFSELPENLRVNGALANLQDFSDELNCKSITKMNPTQRCIIY